MAAASKIRTIYRCSDCGAGAARWEGRCATCAAWNTIVEERIVAASPDRGGSRAAVPRQAARPLGQIDPTSWQPQPSGIGELDRVLGGGFVAGSVTLVGGEPGIGKSTLLLQVLAAVAGRGERGLLISGEESVQQVRLRAERLLERHGNGLPDDLWLAAETELPEVLGHIAEVKPSLVVIDSIQTMHDPTLESSPGSVTQVRECAHALVRLAKDTATTIVLVGHVTKEGSLAGPRVLEHVVDTVLAFEGDRHHALRLLRAVKHRFGATGELGLFEMVEGGLIGVADPSQLFLGDRPLGVPGSIVVAALEGQRPLLVEVQALVDASPLPIPRRVAQGLDGARLSVLLAVLGRRCNVKNYDLDIFASAVGGVRLTEPAVDLGILLAIASSISEQPLPGSLVAVGEVGLAGEIRQVAHMERRLKEAARLGFDSAVVPESAVAAMQGTVSMRLIGVSSMTDAVRRFGLEGRSRGLEARAARREKSQDADSPG